MADLFPMNLDYPKYLGGGSEPPVVMNTLPLPPGLLAAIPDNPSGVGATDPAYLGELQRRQIEAEAALHRREFDTQGGMATVTGQYNTSPMIAANPFMQAVPPEGAGPAGPLGPEAGFAYDRTAPELQTLAMDSLMAGEKAATVNDEINRGVLGTLLGDIDILDLMKQGAAKVGDVWSSPEFENFLSVGRDALAGPHYFGDWGVEDFARAQVAREQAAAASAQDILLEQIKKGPTGMIDASWKADWVSKISKFSSARKLMDEMRKLATDQVGGAWQSGAKIINELGDLLGVGVGENVQQTMNAMRAQLIAHLQGAFGREISPHEHKLIDQMLPKAGKWASSQDFFDALDTFQRYIES